MTAARDEELRPEDAAAHYNLAVTYMRMGNFSATMKAVDESLRLRPNAQQAMILTTQLLESIAVSTDGAE